MKKILALLTLVAVAAGVGPLLVKASVTASSSSLLTSAATAPASSSPVGLFAFTLGQNAAETLSSITVTLSNAGSSTATGSDIAALTVYKDNGNGTFESGSDPVAGSQTAVNIGSPTTINTTNNNTIDGGKFFVALTTSGTWSSNAPTDTIVASIATNAIITSSNSPSVSALATSTLAADSVVPQLNSVFASNTGGNVGKGVGDSITLTFSEATNKASISNANIASTLQLNNGHSWLDGSGNIGNASWNGAGTVLTITLSGGSSLPTVTLGDTVTVSGGVIKDTNNNNATGTSTITGTFGQDTTGPTLANAIASNTGGGSIKEAGDTVVLTFDEATNKPNLTNANIVTTLVLSNGHSWLDGSGQLGATSWSSDGKTLTITLTSNTSVPSMAVGDTVTVQGSVVQDTSGNNASGSRTITGTFGDGSTTPPSTAPCSNGLVNGEFYYQIGSSGQIFKANNCVLDASSISEVRQLKDRKAHELRSIKKFLKHAKNDRWEQNNGHDNGKHKGWKKNGKDRD